MSSRIYIFALFSNSCKLRCNLTRIWFAPTENPRDNFHSRLTLGWYNLICAGSEERLDIEQVSCSNGNMKT